MCALGWGPASPAFPSGPWVPGGSHGPLQRNSPADASGLAGIGSRGSGGSGAAPRPSAGHAGLSCRVLPRRGRGGASVRRLGAGARHCPGPMGAVPGGSPTPSAPRASLGARPPGDSPALCPAAQEGRSGLSSGAPGGPRPGRPALLSGFRRSLQLAPAGPTSGPAAWEVLSRSSSGCCQKREQKRPGSVFRTVTRPSSAPVRRRLSRSAHPQFCSVCGFGEF